VAAANLASSSTVVALCAQPAVLSRDSPPHSGDTSSGGRRLHTDNEAHKGGPIHSEGWLLSVCSVTSSGPRLGCSRPHTFCHCWQRRDLDCRRPARATQIMSHYWRQAKFCLICEAWAAQYKYARQHTTRQLAGEQRTAHYKELTSSAIGIDRAK
jgi:hypothetical protein